MSRRRKHRLYQFSLATCLAVLTAIGLGLGVQMNRVHQERSAADQIRQFGGHVRREQRGAPRIRQLPLIGTALFGPMVVEVHFLGPHVHDKDIATLAVPLRRLARLEAVTFMETAVTSVGARELEERLPGVRVQRITPILQPTSQSIPKELR